MTPYLAAFADAMRAADRSIRPDVGETPLLRSAALSQALGCEIYLKCEQMHSVGSFKLRGATNKLRQFGNAAAPHVITASTGNHGQAVAVAAARRGISVQVYVPSSTPDIKLEGMRRLGATLVLCEGDALAAELAGADAARRAGMPFIAPYNDRDVIAGQSTIGLEIARQLPDVENVFLSVGGGGLASGVGLALALDAPRARLHGCWSDAAVAMYRSLEAGHIVETEDEDTIADGAAGNVETGSITFPICQEVLASRILVPEADIWQAMRTLVQSDRMIVEGAAGLALAGAIQEAPRLAGRKVVIVLCGRNLSASYLHRLLA